MATTYGGEVGIDSNAMVLALLLTQFVAFPCSILSGTLAKKFGSMRMIKIFIVMYMAICLFGYGLDTELEFWILAVSVGICQGGIQARPVPTTERSSRRTNPANTSASLTYSASLRTSLAR